MAKTITLSYKNKTYTLEYTRETVKQLEMSKFTITDVKKYPMTALPVLFFGAFRANHPTVKMKLTEEILDQLKNKEKLVEALAEMYTEPYEALFDEEKGNVDWETTGF